jgi:hypothetical protein
MPNKGVKQLRYIFSPARSSPVQLLLRLEGHKKRGIEIPMAVRPQLFERQNVLIERCDEDWPIEGS